MPAALCVAGVPLRRSSPAVKPTGADPDRRRVSDLRRRGDAGGTGLIHGGGAAGPAVVVADHWSCGVGALSAGLRQLAVRKGRELSRGLAVLRSLGGGSRVIGFVLVAVFAQIFRNWLLLHAVGMDASFFDAIAVLIAVVTLGQLPVGPSVRAAAAVVILGRDGVAAAAAAGVLMTVTGTLGGLGLAAWAAPTGSGPSIAEPGSGVLSPKHRGRARCTNERPCALAPPSVAEQADRSQQTPASRRQSR
jgi:hypothetical protein